CLRQAAPRLGSLAQRIEPHRKWRDLVVCADTKSQLGELCNRARYRDVVLEDWGFHNRLRLGKGLNALFCGTPGAGKTLAAEVVASELTLDLYKVDLSQVVSKFIGDTEK